MSAAEVLRQAEELKAAVSDTTRCANEVWVSRQALQDIYQKLLIIDLEFALDKKVEQDLWNHAFKKQISTLQNQAKEKQNQKRGEVQSSLNLFLEAASGFYLHLLQVICSAFQLDLPFRRKSSNYGIMREYGPVMSKIRTPKRSSCMYICQDCLVHLGDIARYRQQIDQAQVYYRHAAHLVPFNGQPYNQLAILEAAKGNKLSTVFFHIRSIAVKHPFLVAMTNLEKFYAKISKDSHDFRLKLPVNEFIGMFLQLHAFVHLYVDLTKAKLHADRLLGSLPSHIVSNSFSSYQLVQMVTINLFSLYHSKRKLNSTTGHGSSEMNKTNDTNGNVQSYMDVKKSKDKGNENSRTAFELLFDITLSTFEVLLQSTPKDESKSIEFHTLAPIKVLLDWLRTDPDFLSNPAFKTSSVWMNLCELLNSLQFYTCQEEVASELQKLMSTPLPEDCDLECFLPVSKAHSNLTYYSTSADAITEDLEMRLRCQKLIMSGFWIAEEFPSLNLLNVHQLPNGRLEFSTQIKPIQGNCGDHKATRQNVAIQAIMQKGNKDLSEKKREGVTAQLPRQTMSKTTGTDARDPPEKLDAGVTAHAFYGASDNDRGSEKSFSSWSSSLDRQFSSQGSTGSPGSSQSVSTETNYPREFHPMLPYFFPQQGNSPMFVRPPPPSNDPAVLSKLPVHSSNALQAGGVIGQSVINPVDRDSILSHEPGQASQNGLGFLGPPKDVSVGQFNQMAALYGPRMQGFVAREQLGAPMPPQNQTFFRIGQPFSYGPQPRNVMPMYMPRQEDPSRGMPLAMGVLPQQLQWSRQPLMPQRMPFMPYPSLAEPPPKVQPALPEEFGSQGPHVGFPPLSPSISHGMPSDPGLRDGMNSVGGHQPVDRDHFLFTPGSAPVGVGGFPVPPHLQSDMMNGADAVHQPGMSFARFRGYRDLESDLEQSQFTGPQAARLYGLHNGEHISSIMDNPVSSQSSLFQAEKRMMNNLDLLQQNQEPKVQDILKPDSPQPIGTRSQSSLFTSSGNAKKEQIPTSNTYTLFSQSPWPVGITKSTDGNSHASSTFGSSNSSLRTTPDPDERSSVSSGGGYRVGLFGRTLNSGNDGPWNTPSMGGNPLAATTLQGGASLLSNNLQSLWNTGPSPLEKLLEQQKQQRQCEPR